MTQTDIQTHYEQEWGARRDAGNHVYSDPVADAVVYPRLVALLRRYNVRVDDGCVLDVGSGSGRWIRFLLERYRPQRLLGVDFAAASVDLLRSAFDVDGSALDFRVADITEPNLDLGERFDLINIANVLFHIPEHDRFERALVNLARHLDDGGCIVTTEYLPHRTMRTEWMLVRDRYEFARLADAAGLTIAGVEPACFFSSDPMGIDGPDGDVRERFHAIRGKMQALTQAEANGSSPGAMTAFLAEIEETILRYCETHVPAIDLPGQKLVVLRRQ